MNIFDALNAGNGKATKKCFLSCYIDSGEKKHAFVDTNDCLIWNTHRYVSFGEIKGNDWIPYVPTPSKTKHTETFKHVNSIKLGIADAHANDIEKVFNKPITITFEWEG